MTRLEEVAAKTNAFITIVNPKKSQKSGPLSGQTFVLKDSYVTKGIKTTAASKILGLYSPVQRDSLPKVTRRRSYPDRQNEYGCLGPRRHIRKY
ncbi:hypothetical protein HY440_00805 [Candidatus Microgenomates bacterium]|nr:hypothetical protein [Candidatus Microgenomates bacterium]